ncbi:MAG: LamG-like jellyroll fold domain-containing protein [Cyclobacteriaceae bacterium]
MPATLFIALAVPSFAQIDPINFSSTAIASGSSPNELAIADFDGDGLDDVALCNTGLEEVVVYSNSSSTSSLSFTAAASLTMTNDPIYVTAVDLNNDGLPDLVAAGTDNFDGTHSIKAFLNTSAGSGSFSFSAGQSYEVSSIPNHVEAADMDGDGLDDIVVTVGVSNHFSIFRNLSSGSTVSFATRFDVSTSNTSPNDLALSDLDLNGKTDILIVNSGSDNIEIFRNNSTVGTLDFTSITQYATGSTPWHLVVDDFNADGYEDVAVSLLGTNSIRVFGNLASGPGSLILGDVFDITTSAATRLITSGDLNNDGRPEIVATDNNGNIISVFENTTLDNASTSSAITFSTVSELSAENKPRGIQVADLTGNGVNDMVVVSNTTGNLLVLENSLPVAEELLVYFPFNNNGLDESGNGNDASVATDITYVADRFDSDLSALSLNGSNSYMRGEAIEFPLGAAHRTIAGWMKLDATSASPDIMMVYGDNIINGGVFGLGANAQKAWLWGHNADLTGSTTMNLGEWYFVAATYDGSEAVLYLNGIEEARGNLDLNTLSTSVFDIGANTNEGWYTPASLDEIQLFSYALSPSDILSLYETGGLFDEVAIYLFDGDASDGTGNGIDGTVNGATLAVDRFGNADAAYTFDGSSNYINTTQTFANNQPFSASVWVYWDGNTGRHTALSWFEGSLSSRMYLGVTETGNLAFGDSFETGTPLEAGKWVHLVGTYDGNQSRLYIDGIESDVSITGLSYQFNTLTIGRQGTASSEYWDGKIDDIRIYDIALDASEILGLYAENGYEDPREVLMDFYNSTNGDSWVDNSNWGTDAPLDDWYGVDTNEGVVTTLSLAANNLTGTLPASLGSLVSLDYLLLFNNAITGTIPPEYGNLTKATYFNISLNQLTGTIPTELANLTNCNIFSLSRNQLTGDIPGGLASWTNTAGGGIYLYTNQLTGLPDLSGLSAGTVLSVYGNQIGFDDLLPNVALNSSGSALYASPQTLGDPVSLEPAEGEELTLSAIESASGTQYQWYYNDELIEGANLIDHVFNFTSSVEGEYYCVMTNDNVPDVEIRRANYSLSDGVNAAPTVISMQFYGLDNAAANNLPVADFSAEDVDPGESHVFELVDGEGDINNDLFVIEGATLKVAGNIDATAVEYSIRVRVTDSGGASIEEIFLLDITPSHGCDGGVFSNASGTISDGSGVYRYNADFTCDWLIQYPDKSRVLLEFTEFDTEFNYDFLYIYDGENDQAPLLAVLSGSDIPAPLQSGSESVYIRFVSDEYITAGGWSLNYSEVGPVAYYPFNGNGLDVSDNGWDGAVNGPILVNDRFGSPESAYWFNGIDNYIQSGATLTDNAPFSISAWVKWDNATSDYRTIVSWWNAGASGNTYLGTTAGSNELRFGDTWIATGAYLDYGRWVHVVATYDGSNSTIYLDGEYINSSSGNSYGFAGGDLYIGRQGTQNGEYWTNRMDDVLIYDFALSEENVAALYEEGSTDLLAYLPFTSDLSDATDNGFDAYELGSGNGLTTDRFALDGSGVGAYNFDYINASPLELSNTINYDFGSEITVTAWIKPNSFPAADVSIVKNVMNGQGFDLRLSTGDLDPGVTDYTRRVFGDVTGISYGDAGEVYLGNWAHVAFTYSSNGGVRIYVNGQVLVNYGFVEGTEGSAIPVSEGSILIGDGFDGIIDEVQIHRSALSDEEIREVYNQKLWPFEAQALRGPEDVGGEAVRDLSLEPIGGRYVAALDLQAGTYHFRLTDFDEGLPEAFMGDNELDGIADVGGATVTLSQGLYAVGLWETSLGYYLEPITSIGIIGSATTGDDSGWNDDVDLTEIGSGIYQIKNIKLYDGEWKLRVNDTWNYLDWGYLSDGQLEYFGANIFVETGTYTLTVDVINNTYELLETSWGNWDAVAELYFDGDLTDESGYGNDGTSASVSYVTDRFGETGSAFDLPANELVTIPASPEMQLSNGFTMNIWLNPVTNDNAGTIFHSVGSFHNHIYPTEFSWRYFQNGVEISIEGISVEAPTGQWTMLTWVYDGGEMRFYDDGVLVHTEPVYGDIDITGNAYEIGNSYDGYVDDFLWIDGVLSDEEIKGLYNDHLWLYYPLNASATDESGNGYNGVLTRAVGFSDRFGDSNQALYFDGTSDVDAPALPITPKELTVSGWFNASTLVAGSQQIIDLEGVAALAIYDDTDRYIQGILNLGGDYRVLSAPVTSDEWHFAAITYDENFFRFYLDGELVEEIFNTNQILYEADQFEVRLGRFEYTEGNYYTGAADDMRIYDRALSEEELYELYGAFGWLTEQTGILADYPFQGDADDVSGQLNDGLVLGAEPAYDRFGDPNSAFSFNGVDAYIELPEVDYFGGSDQFTVSWWVNPANTEGLTGVLNFGNMQAQVIDGVLYTNLYFGGSGEVSGSTSLSLDEWQHLTLTYDGANTRLYKNGSEVAVTLLSGTVDSRGSGTPSTVGTTNVSEDFFDGEIDDIKVYNRTFSAGEVDELYRTGGFPFGGDILTSLNEDFESACLPASWTEYNSELDLINCGTNANNDSYVNINGYGVGSGESWLITPMIDFNAGNDYFFSVEYSNLYTGPDVEVLYSMDYNGVPNPTGFTWINLTEIETEVNAKTESVGIVNTGDIFLPSLDGTASIAFRYTSDGPDANQSINFSVDDVNVSFITVNENPTALTLSNTNVYEGQEEGTDIGTFITTDPDSDTFTYSLVSGTGTEDDDNGSFAISGDRLITGTGASFSLSGQTAYNILVRTEDNAGGMLDQSFTINVTGTDPADEAHVKSYILPDQIGATTIDTDNAQIYITLADGTSLMALTPTFTISSGASTTHVSGVETDYVNGELYFDVTSSDASVVTTWHVNIRSPHDPWAVQEMNDLLEYVNPAFTISNTSGTETAWSIVSDADNLGNNLLSMSNLNDGSGGMYKSYDLGTSAATVVFRTKIDGSPERLTDVDIHLNGFREQVVLIAPDKILFQRSGLMEVVAGLDFSKWNTFRITADASSGTQMDVELYIGEESTPILTSSSTEATSDNHISFGDGSTTATYASFIDYLIFDKSGAYGPDDLSVASGLIVDGFFRNPTDISLSSTSINEGESAGTQIGVFSTTDADSDTFTYSLVDGSLDNFSFSISGNELFSEATFDFDVKNTYSILVQTEDEQGLTFQKEFTIDVEKVADPADPYAIEWIQKNTPYIGIAQYLNDELVTSVDLYTNYARYQTLIKLSDDGEVTWVSDSIKYVDDPEYYFSHLRADDSGNIYALGHLRGTIEINDTEITSNDGNNGDLIILKYNAAGEIVEHVIIGGSGIENQYGFVVLPSGNLLLSFYFDQFFSFQGKNFDNGISSRALLELDASLNATATSVVHPDNYGSLVLTNEDRLFMTNHGRNAINEFSLIDYSVIATYQLPDAYECYDHTNQMVADGNGDLIFTGIEYTSGSSTSVNNIFAGKFNTGTNTWDWNYIMGSTGGNDEPVRLDVDGDNNVYLAGHYRFSWNVGGVGLPTATLQDIFLAKFDVSGSVLWVHTYGSDEDDYMQALAVDKTNNEVFLTAGFNGSGATVLTETLNNPIGIWLKLSPLGGDGPISVSSIDGFGTYTYNDDQGAGFFNESFDSGITDRFTVEALIRYKGFDGPGDWYNQFVNTAFFTIYVDYDDNENINLQCVVRNRPGQSVSDDYYVGGSVDVEDFGANTWHHIAVTYGEGAMTFFLDGDVLMSNVANYDPMDGVQDFLRLIQEVSGDIDEVRIWNEKRTIDEIRVNIQNEIAASSAGLVGYWPMNTKADDGSGSYTPDATGNGQHLFLEANADILELNLEPTDIQLTNNSVREGLEINTIVGTLSTTDGNSTDSHTYSLVAGTGDVDNARFNINGDELRTSEIFNYTGQTYQIRIQTEDVQGATYQEIFFIGVDQNLNNAPTITGATFDIDENPNNGDIVSDAIQYEDLDGDDITFAITAGNSSGAFAIGSTDGVLTVNDASLFDYESISPKFYTIEITVSDAIESSFASFTINVNNVDEAATFSNFTAPDSYDTGTGGFTVSADIDDPDGLSEVHVFYKRASEEGFNTRSMTDNAGGNYSTTFSGTEIGLISIEYYVETTDILSNKTQSTSKTTSVNRSTSLALDVDNLAGITSGTTVEAYSILAFPFSGATVNGVFTNLMPYDEEKWRLVSYSSSGYSDKKSGGLTAGTGYFFITSESADIDVSGRSVVLDNGVYKINLSPDANGWSLIGNPFQGALDWTAVVQHNIDNAIIGQGDVQTGLQGYNGQFTSQSSLSILEGAFVNSNGSITGFEIPATAVNEAAGGRIARSLNTPEEVFIDELDWSLDLFFETPSYKYSVGGIGINPDAADDHDYHDLAQLPRFSTYLDLTFDDGSTRSIKQSDEFKSWEFQINNSLPEKYIDMTWDIPVSSSRTIIFVDAASRQIYDLSEVRNIKVPNDASAKHQLYYGDKDEIFQHMDLPFDALFNLYPNPVRDYLNLEIYASDNKSVTVEFVSIDGKVAYTEVLDLQRGLTRKQINLVGKNVPEGVYLIKVNTEVLSKFIKQ